MIRTVGETSQIIKSGNVQDWIDNMQSQIRGIDKDVYNLGNLDEINNQKSFGEFLSDSLVKVNGLQQEANAAIEKLAAGETQELHETLLTVEKAEIAFKAMNQIRQKVLEAYREVMKMQI